MPFTGGESQSVPTPVQGADTPIPFSSTLAVVNTAEDFVTVPAGKTCTSISLVNHGPGSIFFAVGADATVAGTEVKVKEGYSEAGLAILSRLSFIGETGKKPHIRGVAWVG